MTGTNINNGPDGGHTLNSPMTTTQQSTARQQWLDARAQLWSLLAIVWSAIHDAAARRLATVKVPMPRWLDLAILSVVEAWEAIPAPIRAAMLATVRSIAMATALTVRETVTFTVAMVRRQWTAFRIRSLTMT